MSEPKKATAPEKDAESTPKQSGGLFKNPIVLYAALGLGSLLVTVGIVIALGGSQGSNTPATEPVKADSAQVKPSVEVATESDENSIEAEAERTLAAMDSLEAIESVGADEKEGSTSPTTNHDKMTLRDSLKAVDWFDTENAKLELRKRDLEKKERDLAAAEKSVDAKLAKLNQAESARVAELAKLYDSMKPEQVARLVAQLDDNMVVSLLPRMKPANASKVLATIPPDRAAKISHDMITLTEK